MTPPISRPGRIELTIGVLLLTGIVGAGIGLALARSTPVEPGVVFIPAGLDFGSVWEQPAYRHKFQLTNPTDEPIRVAEIRTGCGCTRVEPQSFTLEPGETKSLVATLDFTGRGGSSFAVDLLPLLAHQPPGGRTVWTLRGKVRKNPIALAEPSLDFGDDVILGEPPPTREVEVSLADGSSFNEFDARVVEGEGQARLEDISGGRWRLLVTPPEDLPIGPFDFTVRLAPNPDSTQPLGATGSASANDLPASTKALAKPVARPSSTTSSPVPFRDILVTGTVRDDIAAWPATVNFGVLEVGETGREYVVLASHRGRPLEVTHIEAPEGVTVEPAAEQIGDGSRTYVIEQRAAKPGEQKGRVTFHVESSGPAGEPSEVELVLETAYYGTAAVVAKSAAPAASAGATTNP